MDHVQERPSRRGAVAIVRRLREAGHQAVLAGGCVRDMLLGRRPKDYDVATSARPDDVCALFARVIEVGRAFGVCRVLLRGQTYEVATFRAESGYADGRHPDSVTFCDARTDAARRDFTVNAMFWDPEAGDPPAGVVDDWGGRRDLAARVVRAVGDPAERFAEDHLRMLRAVRFAARLGFTIDPATADAIRSCAPRITRVSAERLQEELRIMLTGRAPADALRLMEALGLLEPLFPELAACKGCEQPDNYHPEGDVYTHTMLTVEKLSPRPSFALCLAALLHDIGKPPTRTEEGMRFPEHCPVGAEMAEAVCRRLRMPNAETERVRWLVQRHMYFKDAAGMRDSTLKKLFAEPGFDELAELHRADALASWGVLDDYHYVLERRRTMPPEQVEPPRLITGHDLLAQGWREGPRLGRALAAVREAQLDGQIETREQALALARRLAADGQRGDGSASASSGGTQGPGSGS